tara:strand:+ start:266 stop:607 length:342 start_codon:yes stop_codon:yes gene_type:complete
VKVTKSKLKQIIKEELSNLQEDDNEIFRHTLGHHSMVLTSKMNSLVAKIYEAVDKLDLERTEERAALHAAAKALNSVTTDNPLANVVLNDLKFLMSPAVVLQEIGDSLMAFDE